MPCRAFSEPCPTCPSSGVRAESRCRERNRIAFRPGGGCAEENTQTAAHEPAHCASPQQLLPCCNLGAKNRVHMAAVRASFALPVQAWMAGPRAGSDCSATIARATASGVPTLQHQHSGCRATSVVNANRPCAQSLPAHVPGVDCCLPIGKPNRSRGRGGWLHRDAEGFRACRRFTHRSRGGRAKCMVCCSRICARPQATPMHSSELCTVVLASEPLARCGRPPRRPRAVASIASQRATLL